MGLKNNVTILILIDGFLQYNDTHKINGFFEVTILILIDGFLQLKNFFLIQKIQGVTILILIDGFLQYISVQTKAHSSLMSQSLF